jgi:hypothetical protein
MIKKSSQTEAHHCPNSQSRASLTPQTGDGVINLSH